MSLSIGELVGYVTLDTDGVDKGAADVESKLGGAGGKWGTLLAGAGLAAGAAFATSMVKAMDVEAGNDRVAAALDLNAAQANRAGQVAGNLYADAWGESMGDVQGAVEAVMSSIGGMRNASQAELQAVTEAALTFSTAMEVDVSRAASVAGTMVKSGLAKNATEAFDLLTEASSRVPKDLREDVLDATEEYGQFFSQLGIDGPQAMAMLASGAAKGTYGIDKAGDAVKEFTIRATDMSTSSKGAYKAIGLDAGKMADAILAGGDRAKGATDKIVTGLLGIKDPAKRANASIALFGTPLEDLSTKEIPAFLRSMQSGNKGLTDFEGATKRAGQTLNDNASTNITGWKRAIEQGFVQTLGGQVIPALESFGGALRQNKGIVVTLAAVIGVLTAVTAAHGAATAVAAAGGMAKWLKQTKLISSATKVWTAIQWAMNAALAANPIGIVIAILAALVVGVIIAYKKSETFRKIVDGAFSAVKKGAQALGSGARAAFGMMKKAMDAVGAAGRWLWNNALAPAFRFIVRGIGTLLSMWASMLRGLSKVPGFGWARSAADALQNAANKANGLASGIRNIPPRKDIFVTYHETTIRSILNKQANDPRLAGARAKGGPVWPSGAFLVGENGPEIFTPQTRGSIIPNRSATGHRDGAQDAQQRVVERSGPLIGQVVQQPGEDANTLAERLWFKTRTRG